MDPSAPVPMERPGKSPQVPEVPGKGWLWLAGLEEWPYTLLDLASQVCTQCGVALENEEIPNGDFYVQKFSADGVTGRDLMRWIGQVSGRFCVATADGNLRFDWYKENL